MIFVVTRQLLFLAVKNKNPLSFPVPVPTKIITKFLMIHKPITNALWSMKRLHHGKEKETANFDKFPGYSRGLLIVTMKCYCKSQEDFSEESTYRGEYFMSG